MEQPHWLFEQKLQHLVTLLQTKLALLQTLLLSLPLEDTAGNLILYPEHKAALLDNSFEAQFCSPPCNPNTNISFMTNRTTSAHLHCVIKLRSLDGVLLGQTALTIAPLNIADAKPSHIYAAYSTGANDSIISVCS
ncbi:unnamed protein product [Macrosiphum euphorbiae]|uniref:Uncharacterized protein n=1 Tax=Macrosiphum euphorbiae TaxID=13131 RepID=A0AAV0WSW4_9HEMI|nr:unnamed protein product [Macrosiphum euphorbiae]